MNTTKAIRRRGALRPLRPPLMGGDPPLIPPAYTIVGGGVRKDSHFFTRKLEKPGSRDCESLRMMLRVLGRVPAPVVGVNDTFLRQ